ncbi:MAG: sigma-70 family RNA polymerase sigma factor [Clostridia bacterium]|nr:sigma-70 family RNA polymerase sigma factor [Clostridia bacterium]
MTDNELVAKIKKGDMHAFSALVKAYESKVINISYSLLSSREDALDAAQEIFVKIYRNIDSFRGDSTVSTWIYRITKNVCCDYLRKRKSNVISLDEEDEDKKIEIPDETSSPGEVLEKKETVNLVRNAISKLDENQRIVITLFDIEGLSYEEISDIIKCPLGTVKSRLYRARESLRKILADHRELFT